MTTPLTRAGQALLTRSHPVRGRILASVNGSSFTIPVDYENGAVQVTGTSPVRRTLQATVKATITDPVVNTLTTELRAEYGLVHHDGSTEWVPVGTFVVTDAQEEAGGVQVTCYDRWSRVADARFTRPVVTSGNTAYAIGQLLQQADDRITYRDESGSGHSHRASVHERDRDRSVMDLARSIGCEVFFDPEGVAVLRPVPSLDQPVAWRVVGGEGGAIVRARRGHSRERTYNAFVAIGEQADGTPGVRAVALDSNPRSPTFYGGPFGRRPRFFASSLITSTAQAQVAANAGLRRYLGVARTLQVDGLPRPDLEPGSVIAVEVAPGVHERHLVDGYTLPLGPGGVQYATRAGAEYEAQEGEE